MVLGTITGYIYGCSKFTVASGGGGGEEIRTLDTHKLSEIVHSSIGHITNRVAKRKRVVNLGVNWFEITIILKTTFFVGQCFKWHGAPQRLVS